MSGRTAFGVNLGFKKLPGGTIATTGPLRVEGGLEADGATFAGPVVAPNSISSFLPGQTAGVPDTASLAVNAGASQRVVLPAGDAFRFDFSGFGPFALRFGTSSVAAVATDFPGIVGLPIYYRKPEGATHVAVYGIGAGSVVVSGGTTP